MAKRFVIECDLCHQETADELSTLSFKAVGKSKGRSYDICKACALAMETQLVSNKKLLPDWSFGGSPDRKISDRRLRLEKDQPTDDDLFVREKSRAIKNPEETQPPTTNEDDRCLHYNKTPPTLSKINGEDGFVQNCKKCGVSIPIRSLGERNAMQKLKKED